LKEVAEKIAQEIASKGVIPFERFMELALYCPVYGYYEKEADTVGRRGDYYTNVSVGNLFGELLAFQFAEWLEDGRMAQLVEAGAHDGRLAKDILSWVREYRPVLFEGLEYTIIERSERRAGWQKRMLGEFSGKVRWVEEVSQMKKVRGIIFSNELLDAMPVRRFGWDRKNRMWLEWGVGTKNGEFVWKRMPETEGSVGNLNKALLVEKDLFDALPEGFTMEWNSSAESWWSDAARVLERGKLVTIDYGLEGAEFLVPERMSGTLRAYRGHHLSDDLLANPGDQDLTAHVNFTVIKLAGETNGLKTDPVLNQSQFLTKIASRTWNTEACFGEWTSERRKQFQTLTHVEHLGRAFRVLIQSRED
jgi:SAM-dependent MidA family methyltransferase